MHSSFYSLKEKEKSHFRVSIFGSARTKKNDKIYKEVKKLAYALAKREIDVVTGGGPGLMEAGNEGHLQGSKSPKNKSHSIGVGIKLPWEQKFNKSVEVNLKCTK